MSRYNDLLIEIVNYIAFTVSLKSWSSANDTLGHGISSQDDSEDEDDLQMTYKKLFIECIKLKKLNKLAFKKLNEVEHEKKVFDC